MIPKNGSEVLLITNIPTPYRIPLFNELNNQLRSHGISFKVVFAALTYPRRKWQIDMSEADFPYEVLSGRRLPSRNPDNSLFTYGGLRRILCANPKALIIVSGFSIATMLVYLHSLCRPTRYIIWSGAIQRKDRPDSSLRLWQRRVLVSRGDSFIAYGTQAREYLINLGADPSRISIGINTVDTDFFHSVSQQAIKPTKIHYIKELICIGDLSSRKRVDLLLPVVRELRRNHKDFFLRLVGIGPDEHKLRSLVLQWRIADCIIFDGYKQKSEVAKLLGSADCLLFPTGFDIWGLVLVEAMAAGLICLSSIRAGATVDLIRDGVTGFALDFENTAAVVERLVWVLDHPEEARAIGSRASQFAAERLNLKVSAKGFVDSIRIALNPKNR